ncbi:carboxymuconolactone decarboxylase family protein [Nocardia higoensis]|uniref:Carboxymuconolactone decarboxylase family protein n=1 Tax=Nocardia higoensis TaxID=228599 RepID=A0ABS0DCV3_9NOCA|nr:carboxymuconolactone decarboxylase family protein [Nocardia higoensis]MBF6355698.1 carboxymuconolactone decarboxylase family protein [Nocardia higoensis]
MTKDGWVHDRSEPHRRDIEESWGSAMTKSAGHPETSIGKTYTLRGLFGSTVRLLPLAHRAAMVWGFRSMAPDFREEIMLTVARANGCRYCSYIHQEWAIRTGVSNEEIAQLEGTDLARFDRAKWSALVYARALTEADFEKVPDEIAQDVAKHYTDGQIRNIKTVALVMTIVNRSANTMDALLARLRGRPQSSSIPAEVVITATLVATAPVIVPLLVLVLRKSPIRLWREFRAFNAGFALGSARVA